MRILVVPTSDWLSHPIQSRLHFIFERLSQRHEVYVIRYPIPLWQENRKSKAIVKEAMGLPIRDLSLYYVINSPNHLRTLNNILKTCKIDIIVFANILSGAESVVLSKIYKVPTVCDYLGHFPESASSFYSNPLAKMAVEKVVLTITKWNLAKANHVVTVSDGLFRWLKTLGFRNTSLIPNGVDIDNFKPYDKNCSREKLGFKELKNKFVITYTGSVESWYNLDMVAHATSILNSLGVDSVFQVVGGHLVNSQNNAMRGYEKNVFNTGFIPNNRVSININASDVCVLPLKTMAKNLARPLKLFEYFACGKPVLSLPNSEVEHAFGDAITIFKDAEELSKILWGIAHNEYDFSAKIQRGYAYAKENSWDNHAKSYERLLKNIIDAKSS